LPTSDGETIPHKVLVVSRNALNRQMKVVVVDMTTTDRERHYPTTVQVEPTSENGLKEVTYVLCHDLSTIVRGRLDADPVGRLGPEDLWQVDRRLKIVLDFAPLPPIGDIVEPA
jgi:mRNA-degrading endonuclease toxin of MazEF toxin-antitoxin module